MNKILLFLICMFFCVNNYNAENINYANNFLIKPSFDNTIIKNNFFTIIELTDKNQVLNEYKILNESNNIVWKDDNNLYIKILSSKLSEIKLIRKIENYDEYYNISKEQLSEFNNDVEIISSIQIQANDIYTENITFNFLNDKNLINNLEFKITDLDTNISSNYITTNGIFNKKFDIGNYTLEIINVDDNYLIPIPINFKVDENNICVNTRIINVYIDKINNDSLYKNENNFKIQKKFSSNKRFLPNHDLQAKNNNTINHFKLLAVILCTIGIIYLFRNNFNE